MRRVLIIIFAGLLIGVGLAVLFIYGSNFMDSEAGVNPLPAGAELPESPAVGSMAPDFSLQTINGESRSLAEQRGKIVVMNFWATWCGPCEIEMPMFESFYETKPEQVEIIAVNYDEPPGKVRAYADRLNLDFPILLDPGGSIQELYRVRAYPTTFFVDQSGFIRFHHIGILSQDKFASYLDRLGAVQ